MKNIILDLYNVFSLFIVTQENDNCNEDYFEFNRFFDITRLYFTFYR